jgi:hypothetical protein
MEDRAAAAIPTICDLVSLSEERRTIDPENEILSRTVKYFAWLLTRRPGTPAEHRYIFSKFIKDSNRLLQTIKAMRDLGVPEGRNLASRLGIHPMFVIELEKLHEEAETMVMFIPEKLDPSGGNQLATYRKSAAVELAVSLILDFGNALPTPVLVGKVAKKLIKIALGHDLGRMTYACTDYFAKIEEAGYPDPTRRRNLTEGEKQADREWLKRKVRPGNAAST